MNDLTLEVLEAEQSASPIPRELVLRWMADPDLETRALVYRLTRKGWSRITPELNADEQCSFMARYLLDCMNTDPRGEENIHSGFEAAWEFASWLKHLRTLQGMEQVIARAVRDLEQLYLRSDPRTRNRIETGAVEHILEDKALRKYFAHWRDDPELHTGYDLCVSWGKAHKQ